MAKIPRSVEKGFVVSSLLISTGSLTRVSGGDGNTVSLPLLQFVWFGIYAVTLLLLLALSKSVLRVGARDKLSWLLVAIALFSVLWSTLPDITLRRSVALVGTELFGIYVATRYSLDEQLRLLAWTLGIAAILSLVVTIAIPSYGIEFSGAWRGIYAQKNILARLMVLSAMVFLLLALKGKRHRWIPWAMFGISVLLMLLSASKAALVNFLTLLLLLVLYRALRLRYTSAIPVSIFAILTIGGLVNLISSNSDLLLKSLGKDPTLTGRTELWDAVSVMIWKRPILGYGYGGFWTNGENGPAAYVWDAVNWKPVHAHNGILTLCLDLGLLGVSVFALGYLRNIIRSVSWIRLTKTPEGFWPLIYMSFMFMYNQAESSILYQNDIFWIIYTAVSFSRPIQDIQARELSTYRQKSPA